MTIHLRVDPAAPDFRWVPALPHCERCHQPADDLVAVTLPVVPHNSGMMIERRICGRCVLGMRQWWYAAECSQQQKGR